MPPTSSSKSGSSSTERHRPPARVVGERFEVDHKLGAGVFGEVWLAHDRKHREDVAVKFEKIQDRSQLQNEMEILRKLAEPTPQQGFLKVIQFGSEGHYQYLVIDRLGMSLDECMQKCHGTLTPRSTILIAQQVLHRLEYLHSKCIIHRDIKPENFMFASRSRIHHLHLIDFGLSKQFYRESKHISSCSRLNLTGTVRYASINAHRGCEQSRRDDLEAVGHMLAYFLRGSLPWSGLQAKSQEEKYRLIKEKKESFALSALCAGFPKEFETYLEYCRGLSFQQRPDYSMLHRLFSDAREHEGPFPDHGLEWLDKKDLSEYQPLVPLIPRTADIVQPDDVRVKRSCRFFCWNSSSARED